LSDFLTGYMIMEQHAGYAIKLKLLGGASFFIILGSISVVGGLFRSADSQWQQWTRVIAVFLLIEIRVRRWVRRLNEAIARRERELNRSLSLGEREEMKETMRAAVPSSKVSFSSNFPLLRFVTQILLVTIPAIVLLGVVAAVGAFFAGAGLALLMTVLIRNPQDYL
jgi:hypothetical protein